MATFIGRIDASTAAVLSAAPLFIVANAAADSRGNPSTQDDTWQIRHFSRIGEMTDAERYER